MRPLGDAEIRSTFSRKDHRELVLPPLGGIVWEDLDFLGWIHRSGHLAYLVAEIDGRLQSLVLNNTRNSNGTHARTCSLCGTIHRGDGVKLFSVWIGRGFDHSKGDYFCSDLQCSLYIRRRKQTNAEQDQVRETTSLEGKIARLRTNLERFFSMCASTS